MPIHGYPGGVISATPPSVTVNGASGVFTTEQQMQYQTAGNWPMPLTQISRSLRFNSADSAYLNRTPASASNRKTWTWSGWIKRSALTGNQALFSANGNVGTSDYFVLSFENTSNVLRFDGYWGGATRHLRDTVSVYRDVSAWYHIVLSVDTTQATDTNRLLVYVNNVNYPFSTSVIGSWPAQNSDGGINSNILHEIGRRAVNNDYSLNAYLTEVNFIDGLALTPASFGVTDPATGVWGPRQYTGPYGTNGFYLNFSDNSGTTSTTLGKDYSGNGNNWTPNNFSVTAGAGNDSLVDTPTPYGTDTGAGGEVRGNYATWNPVTGTSNVTLSNGNLDASTAVTCHTVSTIGMTTGLWYWEITQIANGGNAGIYRFDAPVTNRFPNVSNQAYVYNANGYVYDGQANPVGSQYSTYTANDVVGIAFDATNGKLYVAKNGTWQNSGNPAAGTGAVVTGITTSSLWFAGVADGGGSTTSWTANFGQRPFAYTAPSGFKALCTQNLPTPTIGATSSTQANRYFDVVLRTSAGTAGSSVTSLNFQPDFVWDKTRSIVGGHYLEDAVRGAGKYLQSNTTGAEGTDNTYITAFTSNGFTIGTGDWTAGTTLVDWCWKANGAGSSNTAGTITSTVSANTTAGFSVVTWSAQSTAGTVGHGLGVAPSMIIMKPRDSATGWFVYHKNSPKSGSATDYLVLNSTAAATGNSTVFSTAPTSTVFDPGTGFTTGNGYGSMLAYCFAEVAGYSAFGSYTGNGSTDGVFIYTGFRPRYIMIKRTNTTGNWIIYDAARNPANLANNYLYANASDAAVTDTPGVDLLSNGFKNRNDYGDANFNGSTYVYAAFAEVPQKFSLAR